MLIRYTGCAFTGTLIIIIIRRSLHWAREGHYGNAIQALAQGVAETNDTRAFEELLSRHPFHPPPSVSVDPKPALVVDESAVLSCLKAFPKGTSPASF